MNAKSRPRAVFLSIVSAIGMIVIHPPGSLGLLAPAVLIPLLLAIRQRAAGERFLLGWLCGSVWAFFMVGAAWLWTAAEAALGTGPLASLAVAGIASQIYGGVHVALFALALGKQSNLDWYAAVRVAVTWTAVEALRSPTFGGIPWGLLGHSLWQHAVLIQLASIGGVALLSFWLALVNGLLMQAFSAAASVQCRAQNLVAAGFVLLAVCAFGFLRLSQPLADDSVVVHVVASDWREVDDDAEGVLAVLEEVSRRTTAQGVAVTVWPEASLRALPAVRPDLAQRSYAFARELGHDLIFGGLSWRAGHLRNAVYHLSPAKKDFVATYEKRRLVPLAEERWAGAPAGAKNFASGRGGSFTLGGGSVKVAVLLCYEALFADLTVGTEADFILNPSNDVRVGVGAEQQAAMSVFRAVENGISLLRVANLGPSFLVDPRGAVRARLRTSRGAIWHVPAPLPATPFRRIAALWTQNFPSEGAGIGPIPWICLIWLLLAWLRQQMTSGRMQRSSEGCSHEQKCGVSAKGCSPQDGQR